ncbi:MAG: sigma-54-dependent Fis family transcriptional regulator [Candidatus Delongbacteria bacterium]|nr:sigma-54-dependent Fis family transcriptional regulator [Candidatus Cloacimonadota bacterium]MCB9474417.1 sigma-54-dependent Fis family transcriptional regulator [Candidatus Delongbacteria bacterium]
MATDPLNILVVDDEADIREILLDLIQSWGHRCRIAADGVEALSLLEDDPADVVLSDIQMPRMDGMSLLRELVRSHPAMRVMLFTGYGTIESAIEAIRLGAHGYIQKPIDYRQLQKELESLSEERQLTRHGGELLRQMLNHSRRVEPASRNARMQSIYQLTIRRIADSGASVLITGETGTGKELLAELIHHFSSRRHAPLVKVNLAALPDSLIESELFGHVPGAFTGATHERHGRFADANGGTILLDEIGEMRLGLQSKLLRVLQEREFEALGSNRVQKVDFRLISSTNRDLRQEVAAGRFRTDLFFRLNVIEIHLPPLRERLEDLEELVDGLIDRISTRRNCAPARTTTAFLARLKEHDWPGNIRELENLIERLLVSGAGPELTPDSLPAGFGDSPLNPPQSLGVRLRTLTLNEARDLVERELLALAIREEAGNVSSCARRLDIARKNLLQKFRKHGIDPALFRQ